MAKQTVINAGILGKILQKLPPETPVFLDVLFSKEEPSYVDIIRNITIGDSKENAFLVDGCLVLTNKKCCSN
jgi:hypothetical protein